jgi:geranylgeranyl diphosphate synthase type I
MRAAVPAVSVAPELYDILRYHLGWLDQQLTPTAAAGGKAFRPSLCLLCSQAVGGAFEPALPAAVAVELLHNFSLIHDDVEDRGLERRGRPTVFARWGDAIAVNAGDAMLILSQLALLHPGEPERALAQLRILNTCCLRLTEGQHLDISLAGAADLTEAQYVAIVQGKTAALLGCSAELGAVAGGAPPEQAAALRAFGVALGMSFQIQDDVLDIWGRTEQTGKAPAADVRTRKVTLPVIRALNRAPADVRDRLRQIYTQQPSEPSDDDVHYVVSQLDRLGARSEAEAVAETYVREALRALDRAGLERVPADDLRTLALSLLGRQT